MPVMSVYRAGQRVRQYADTDCFAACGNKNDISLIKLAIRTGHPVLIGLDGENTIIKPVADGDEALSFEALYDTCYTARDLDRMQAAGVDDPAKVPLDTFRCDVRGDVVLGFAFPIALTAQNNGDVRRRLRELLDKDVMFRQAIHQTILVIVADWLQRSEDLDLYVREAVNHRYEPLDPPLTPEGPQWRILEDEN